MIVENGDIFLQEAKNIVSFVCLSYSTEAEEGSFFSKHVDDIAVIYYG